MTKYNTGNSVGSVDVRDLYDNAQNLDNFSNGPLDAYPDRFGVSRQSLQGIRNASQYTDIGPYAAGLNFTARNQVFSYLGEFYAPGPSVTLPYTTTGAGAAEIANFRTVGDAVLRQDLANDVDPAKGAGIIGWKRSALSDAIHTVGQMLSAQYINIWEFADLVTDRPSEEDPGTWDWAPAIQGALNYAAALGHTVKGGVVYYTPGLFQIKSTVTYPSAGFVSMTGCGKSSEIRWNGAINLPMFKMDSAFDDEKKIFIEKLHFNGNATLGVNAFNINPTPGFFTVNVTFRNNLFYKINIAVDASNETDQIVFEDNYVLGYATAGINLRNGVCNNWFIKNNHFRAGGPGSVGVKSAGSQNLYIDNNTIQSGNPIKSVEVSGSGIVSIDGLYTEYPGATDDGYTSISITGSDGVTLNNISTHGVFGRGVGSASDPIIFVDNCRDVTIGHLKHNVSAVIPAVHLKVTNTCERVTLDQYPRSTLALAFPLHPDTPANIMHGYVPTPGAADPEATFIKSDKFIGQVRGTGTIAAFGNKIVLDKLLLTGSFLVTANSVSATLVPVRSVSIATYDYNTGVYILDSLVESDAASLQIVVVGGNVLVQNNVGGVREVRFGAIALADLAVL